MASDFSIYSSFSRFSTPQSSSLSLKEIQNQSTFNGFRPWYSILFSKVLHTSALLLPLPQDAFGGNSLCLMVCCLSPSPEDFDATFHTLKYGGMARYILNCPAVNMAIQNSAPASSSATTLTPSSPHTTLRVGKGGEMGKWGKGRREREWVRGNREGDVLRQPNSFYLVFT